MRLAQKHKLRVVEDAAHAIGTEYKGKRLGSFGDTQVFSFHPNKNMTTGEGGAIATRDAELAARPWRCCGFTAWIARLGTVSASRAASTTKSSCPVSNTT